MSRLRPLLLVLAGVAAPALADAPGTLAGRPIKKKDVILISPWLLLTAIGISAVTGYVTLRLYVRQ